MLSPYEKRVAKYAHIGRHARMHTQKTNNTTKMRTQKRGGKGKRTGEWVKFDKEKLSQERGGITSERKGGNVFRGV